ncbi:phage tail assembly chaperone [Pseudomonas sp. P2757]|uniref:phage tail assembly chaperone n=1 Tax=unclassified Pseudomonas TaxID=196821 RepID=UPI003B5B7D92
MERFYSQSTGCVYLSGVHSRMPNDAVPITDECFIAVIGNPEPGKVRSHAVDGLPILIDAPSATVAELAGAARQWRDAQLLASQWLVDRDRDEEAAGRRLSLSIEDFQELLDYRQELRDWPLGSGFPAQTSRPLAPDWLIQLLKGAD